MLITPRVAQESRRKALAVEHRLVALLVLMVITVGLLTIVTNVAARFTSIGGHLQP